MSILLTGEFTIGRRVPEGWTTLRWCVLRNNEVICHRDERAHCEEMIKRFVAERVSHPVITAEARKAELLQGDVSFERSMSQSDFINMRRVTRGESYRIND